MVHGGASSRLDHLDELSQDIRFPYPTANPGEIGRHGLSARDFAGTLIPILRPGDTFGDTPQCVHLKVGFSSDTHAHCAASFSVAGSVPHPYCHTRAYSHQDTASFAFSDSYLDPSTPRAYGHSDAFSHSHGDAGGNRNVHGNARTHAHRGRRFGFPDRRADSHAGGHSQLSAFAFANADAYAYANAYANAYPNVYAYAYPTAYPNANAYAYPNAYANAGALRREVRGGAPLQVGVR